MRKALPECKYQNILVFVSLMLLRLSASCQPAWSNLYEFCGHPGLFSSEVSSQYADDSFIVVAGHTKTPGISNLHTYVASVDYNGQLHAKKNLFYPGVQNELVYPGPDGTTHPLTKAGSNKYLLAGIQEDLVINPKIQVCQPFFYFFNRDGDSIRFVKFVDTIVSRLPYAIRVDKQNNIVVAGFISSQTLHATGGVYYWDTGFVWVAKYDSNLNLLWSKKFLGTSLGATAAYSVQLSNDSLGYIVAGLGFNTIKGQFDDFVMKLDLSGNMVWQWFLPRPYASLHDIDVIALRKGNYAFVSSYSGGPPGPGGPSDNYIYYGKFDESGDTLWTKTFRKLPYLNQGKQILETDNGELSMLCKVSFGGAFHNAVLRTDSTGKPKWYRLYHFIDSNLFQNVLPSISSTQANQLVLGGYFQSNIQQPGIFDSAGQFSWLVLTDSFGCVIPGCQAGDTIWQTNVATSLPGENPIQIFPNPAENILSIRNAPTGKLLLTDPLGRIIICRRIDNQEIVLDIRSLASGVYFVRIKPENADAYVFKVFKL